jgi:hypothetical protein
MATADNWTDDSPRADVRSTGRVAERAGCSSSTGRWAPHACSNVVGTPSLLITWTTSNLSNALESSVFKNASSLHSAGDAVDSLRSETANGDGLLVDLDGSSSFPKRSRSVMAAQPTSPTEVKRPMPYIPRLIESDCDARPRRDGTRGGVGRGKSTGCHGLPPLGRRCGPRRRGTGAFGRPAHRRPQFHRHRQRLTRGGQFPSKWAALGSPSCLEQDLPIANGASDVALRGHGLSEGGHHHSARVCLSGALNQVPCSDRLRSVVLRSEPEDHDGRTAEASSSARRPTRCPVSASTV